MEKALSCQWLATDFSALAGRATPAARKSTGMAAPGDPL
jgi:hypothetical protein